jgi:hypothetical protein
MKKELIAYLAGIMDADGYFTIKRQTYGVRVIKNAKNPTYSERVGIKQVSPIAIDIIKNNFGGYRSIQKPNTPNGQMLYSIELRNKKAHEFVKTIAPYIQIKKRQVEILMELRMELIKPREFKHIVQQKNPHGHIGDFAKYSLSEKQIAIRENLLKEIKSHNDSRNDPFHQPKPW